uniref:Uncharacterized protein LOC104211002 isoform X2 n=1 Tax=Nicotiana sylvestris TaxID=4096 RepID=A0A1U7V7S0_NICSY|nr:PREDICTED: uncharacterized protein LOC104211002 isoform X2 [Nicotiana sylvestris]
MYRTLEKFLKRPATQDEVFEYTHMKKLKDGTKTIGIEPRAKTTYNTCKQSLYEFIQTNQLMIKESQSNHRMRIIWTCGLRRLVAYTREEFTALDQSLVLAVGLLVAHLPQGPRLIRISLSY